MGLAEKTERNWEIRSLVFVFRIIGVLLFTGYLLATAPSAWEWGLLKWVRTQPIDQVIAVAEKSIKRDPRQLVKWVEMRPAHERTLIMEKLEPYSGRISSGIFLVYSRWLLDIGQEKEAVFWRQYGRYRLRYDALRCGSPEATENMTGLLALFPDKEIQGIIAKDPAIIKTSLQRVLDFDAKYPADNNPTDICPAIQKLDGGNFQMVERKDWRAIRHTLRIITENALEKMNEAPDAPQKKKRQKK